MSRVASGLLSTVRVLGALPIIRCIDLLLVVYYPNVVFKEETTHECAANKSFSVVAIKCSRLQFRTQTRRTLQSLMYQVRPRRRVRDAGAGAEQHAEGEHLLPRTRTGALRGTTCTLLHYNINCSIHADIATVQPQCSITVDIYALAQFLRGLEVSCLCGILWFAFSVVDVFYTCLRRL